LIALKTELAVLVTKTFLFCTNGWGKIPLLDPLISQRNCWCRSMGKRKTISGSYLLQVLDTAERMINVVLWIALTTEKLHVIRM